MGDTHSRRHGHDYTQRNEDGYQTQVNKGITRVEGVRFSNELQITMQACPGFIHVGCT
jgi:hypothetical protein